MTRRKRIKLSIFMNADEDECTAKSPTSYLSEDTTDVCADINSDTGAMPPHPQDTPDEQSQAITDPLPRPVPEGQKTLPFINFDDSESTPRSANHTDATPNVSTSDQTSKDDTSTSAQDEIDSTGESTDNLDKKKKRRRHTDRNGKRKKRKHRRRASVVVDAGDELLGSSGMVSSESAGSLSMLLSLPEDPEAISRKVHHGRRLSSREFRAAKAEETREGERAAKWKKMFDEWEVMVEKKKDILRVRVAKGIPNMWRGRAWICLLNREAEQERKVAFETGNTFRMRRNPTVFFDLGVPQNDEAIKRAVNDGIMNCGVFDSEIWKKRVYTILRAYANASDIGYLDGMAFPAGMLCAYNADDYEVFWAFMYLMKGKKIGLEKLYANNYEGLKDLVGIWHKFLSSRFRKVEKNFSEQGVDDMVYARLFFLQLFLGYQFPTALKLRIFDRFTFFGFRALISLGLAFVALNKRALATASGEECVKILTSLDGEDFQTVLDTWDKTWIDKNEYKAFLAKSDVRW